MFDSIKRALFKHPAPVQAPVQKSAPAPVAPEAPKETVSFDASTNLETTSFPSRGIFQSITSQTKVVQPEPAAPPTGEPKIGLVSVFAPPPGPERTQLSKDVTLTNGMTLHADPGTHKVTISSARGATLAQFEGEMDLPSEGRGLTLRAGETTETVSANGDLDVSFEHTSAYHDGKHAPLLGPTQDEDTYVTDAGEFHFAGGTSSGQGTLSQSVLGPYFNPDQLRSGFGPPQPPNAAADVDPNGLLTASVNGSAASVATRLPLAPSQLRTP